MQFVQNNPPLLFNMFYVYVLHSVKDKNLYIGCTSDLRKRLVQHNEGENVSTKSRRPFKLVYYESYFSKKDAVIREKKLKHFQKSYKFLKQRIENSLNEIEK